MHVSNTLKCHMEEHLRNIKKTIRIQEEHEINQTQRVHQTQLIHK